jgi:class 3 adenylate cyclase
MMAISFAFTVYLMYVNGGLVSPLIIYLMIVPAFVVLISDAKWVALWVVLGILAISALYYLHSVGHLKTEIADQAYYLTNSVANYISAIVFISVLFLYSETARRTARAQLLVANRRSDELLLNVLPEETVNELKEKGISPARKYDSATVLFTDFRGFTSASAIMDPEELLEILNQYFMHFDRIADKYGIEKIKTIGDAYMAVGGVPLHDEDHARNVVRAALEIRDWVARSGSTLDHSTFEIRIGVHTGPVVAGIVGIKKFQYDIWGDTVNTASRMESSGEVGKVNIGQSTYEWLKDDPAFEFTYRGEIEAKGKGRMKMYFIEPS